MKKKARVKKTIKRFTAYASLSAGAFIFMIPFFWLITTSMKSNEEYNAFPPRWLPPLPYRVTQSPYVAECEYPAIPVPSTMAPELWETMKSRVIEAAWQKMLALQHPTLQRIREDSVFWNRIGSQLRRELLNGVLSRIIQEGQERIYRQSAFEIIAELCRKQPLTRSEIAASWKPLLDFCADSTGRVKPPAIETFEETPRDEELHLAAWNVGAETMGDYRWEEALRRKFDDGVGWNQLIRYFGKKLWTDVISERGTYREERRAEDVSAAILNGIHYDRLDKILVNAYRNLVLSGITIQSRDGSDYPVLRADGRPVLDWRTAGGDSLKKFNIDAKQCVELAYDFADEDRQSFQILLDLPIPMDQIDRFIVPVRGDLSFHELMLTIESKGEIYRSKAPFHIHHHVWIGAIWQREIPEATKKGGLTLRGQEFIEFHRDSTASATITEPNQALLTLTVHKVPYLTATWQKYSLNYINTFRFVQFGKFFFNSTILTILNIGAQLLVCPLIAFGFARIKWHGRDIVFGLVLATMMLPHQVTMIPQFLIFRYLGMYDTLYPLWLPSLFGTGFFIFLLRQFFMTIPLDYEEAAKLDGCGFIRTYFNISLPLIRPAMAAIVIFQFMATWNDFLRPLIFLNSEDKIPLPLGLFIFKTGWWNQEYGILMAASIIMLLPVLLIFFMAQRHFIESISLTGAKG
ncbi:ABC transporter permease subunit [candidate division KSB1 bacterium]|nr:ABC transporter permease subunit [candidate division KSB1 bacterium]